MTTHDERLTAPAQQPQQPGVVSPECRAGWHGAHCSRHPHRMPSWLPLAVCECPCHDTRHQVRWCRPENADGEAR